VSIVFLIALTLVSCRRDPNVAKKQYLESGNKYFEHGRYKNAAIQYQNAIKIDPKYGPAYYKLGQVYMKMSPPQSGCHHHFRRAVELLEGNQAYQEEYKDSMVQLAELDLHFLSKDKTARNDVPDIATEAVQKGSQLLRRIPADGRSQFHEIRGRRSDRRSHRGQQFPGRGDGELPQGRRHQTGRSRRVHADRHDSGAAEAPTRKPSRISAR
jgi:tetratricopeptide (TPR) repeat protein